MLVQTTHILIVAIENYLDNSSFPKVDYAAKDADDLKQVIIKNKIGLEENITQLKNERATNTAIKTELDRIIKYATLNDRIIVFFAGHGTYTNNTNYILPVDSYKTNITDTGIPIEFILGNFKKSKSNKCIIFLDCCHSGFIPGDDERGIDESFMADELIYNYRNEEYCVGFSSCKSNEKSISHPILKNGVWTHFLIKALNGEGKNCYEGGLLFSEKLQGYLNKEVSAFVPMHSTKRRTQTPMMFGNLSDRFIIADLNESFNERQMLARAEDKSLKSVSLLNIETGDIKSLSGFVKKIHTVPKNYYSGANDFVQKIGDSEVKDEIEELAVEIKNEIGYSRKQVKVSFDNGSGAIVTPDFTYYVELNQSENQPNEYILTKTLDNFTNSNLVLGKEFNSIFDGIFKKLEFKTNSDIDVDSLIDTIEEMENQENIKVEYNPSDTSTCTIIFNEFDYEIFVTSDSISFQTPYNTTPLELINAYKDMKVVLLESQELNLLS